MADRVTPRQLWVAAESLHAVTYFAPRCRRALRAAGLRGFWRGYFASRAAPLGAVDAGPVIAAFYNFQPAMVQKAVPSCWEVIDPARLTLERATAASEVLTQLCPEVSQEQAVAALPALRRATARCEGGGEGRVMSGANARLWPSIEPQLRRAGIPLRQVEVAELWQACTTLREHRGDGHVEALVAHGLTGLEAHLLVAGTQGVAPEVLRDNRGWTGPEWDEARQRLADRGVLRADGTATGAGHRLRHDVEEMTDDLARSAWVSLSEAELVDLYASLLPWARRVQGAGWMPFPNPMGLPQL